MVSPAVSPEPDRNKLEAATTTAEAKAKKSPFLCLSSLKISQLPDGLGKLNSLINLDVSNNKIEAIPEGSLPTSLVELTLTGCHLTELPACIGTLPRLKKLFAGANRLRSAEPAFRSATLQHVGLSYNRVCVLPPAEVLSACRVVSLDMAHNDLEGLTAVLVQLSLLPCLGAVCLAGNPLALAPRYVAEARGRLKQLLFLDGQRLEPPIGSRPGTANSLHRNQSAGGLAATSLTVIPDALQRGAGAAAALGLGGSIPHPAAHGAGGLALGASVRSLAGAANSAFFSQHATVRFEEGGEGGPEVTALSLSLSGLRPAEDPFAAVTARWAEQIAVAEELGLTTPPTLDIPDPPLQPVIYHVEMTDVEGDPVACVPLKLVPPTPPDLTVMFDPKAKAAAAAAAAKEAAREAREAKKANKPGSAATKVRGKSAAPSHGGGGALGSEPAAPRPLETGVLRLTIPLRASSEHRDWLRAGTTVSFYRTTFTATVRPPPPEEGGDGSQGGAAAKPAAAVARKKKQEEAPPVEYDIHSATELLGTAVLRGGAALLDGLCRAASERLQFVPPPALFDERGVRLALADPRHPSGPVGHMEARWQLHMPMAAPGGPAFWGDA
ncbi:hypothetical protein GPECTOR_94g658 [Gonium pectorale]|uniref:Uncharacterized protein n=1 Tax=Gonium pectorale TaxID=33097 RepID=A0A150G0D3_GONPE|nr:hypothetical protein GPECTOR_94g658 [Gonium pectorale]|eukprot:KXZ43336.1 hypothetical protein GPECTOR_94g658 [Gonium pectorale]